MSSTPLRRSPRLEAKEAENKQIAVVTKTYRNTTNDGKHIVKFTDKTVRRSGGIVKKTLLIKRTPIADLTVPAEPQRERLEDGTLITRRYQVDMGTEYIIRAVHSTTRHPDGRITESFCTKRLRIKDIFGYDYTNYKNPNEQPGEGQQATRQRSATSAISPARELSPANFDTESKAEHNDKL